MEATKNSYGNWCIESRLDLTDDLRIRLTTMKRHTGTTLSTLNAEKKEGNAWYFAPFSDFKKTLLSSDKKSTKALVEKMHTDALVMLDQVKYEAIDFYRQKELA